MLTWSGLGMNVSGYGVINSSWQTNIAKYYRDIDQIKKMGFTNVRMGNTDPVFTNAYPLSKAIALYMVSQGLNTMWGPTRSSTLTAANYPAYESDVLAAAAWAQANGISRFSLGNELESINDNTTLTDSQLFDNLKATAVLVRGVYSGEITYNSTGGATIVNLWISKGITPGTDFDYLCFNVYGANQSDLTGFTADAQRIWNGFGTLAKISEFNLVTQSGSLTLTQDQQKIELDNRIAALQSIGFQEAYYFTWKKTSPSQVDSVAYVEGNYRKQLLSLVTNPKVSTASEISSADFNTSSGRIDCGSHAVHQNNAFTFTGVIRPTSAGTHRTLVGWSVNSTPQFRINNLNQLSFVKQNVSNIATTTQTLDINTLYFVALSFSASGDYKIYCSEIDQPLKLLASGNSPQTWTYGTGKLYLGNIIGFAQGFRGAMRNVKLFNRDMSMDELEQIRVENSYNTFANCVAHYELNEGVGTTAIDSVNGNNGIITNAGYTNMVVNPVVL